MLKSMRNTGEERTELHWISARQEGQYRIDVQDDEYNTTILPLLSDIIFSEKQSFS